jgi:two-component system alkaline phosphatase synthesis response regulator PhoP
MRILLVEDEENILDVVKLNLELEGYIVVTAENGKDAVRLFKEQHFDLLILDIMLPEMNGFEICEQVRLTNSDVPIIFLTAKDAPGDRITGLKKGADDYLTKPFTLEELLLRVQNLLKRKHKQIADESDMYYFGKNEVNFYTFEAKGNHGKFVLTKKEAMLLKLLVERKNEVVSRNQILHMMYFLPRERLIILSYLFESILKKNPQHQNIFYQFAALAINLLFDSYGMTTKR